MSEPERISIQEIRAMAFVDREKLNLTPTPAERAARPDIGGAKQSTPAEEQARVSWEPPAGLADAIARKTKEFEDASLCQWGYLTDPDSIDRVLSEIRTLRAGQDRQWGGPVHDDTHTEKEWPEFIGKFINRAAVAAAQMTHSFNPGRDHRADYEANVLCAAALAVAAIQSSRRKRNA